MATACLVFCTTLVLGGAMTQAQEPSLAGVDTVAVQDTPESPEEPQLEEDDFGELELEELMEHLLEEGLIYFGLALEYQGNQPVR